MIFTIDFTNYSETNGIYTIGGDMHWHSAGHLYCEYIYTDDYIIFQEPTYVTKFDMNGLPWQSYNNPNTVIGLQNIYAYDSDSLEVWSKTVDLTDFYSWSYLCFRK